MTPPPSSCQDLSALFELSEAAEPAFDDGSLAFNEKRADVDHETSRRLLHMGKRWVMSNDIPDAPSLEVKVEVKEKAAGAQFARKFCLHLIIVFCAAATCVAITVNSFSNYHCPVDQGLRTDDEHCLSERTWNESASVVLPAESHLWMFWDKGEANLRSQADHHGSKYSLAWKCYTYWEALNPDLHVHLLDEETASAMSPEYRNLLGRGLPVQLMTDVLRLDLLSRYGGVWTDVTVCPLHPLAGRLLDGAADFFVWHGPDPYAKSSIHRGVCTLPPAPPLSFVVNNWFSSPLRPGSFLVDNWFLVAPKAHNTVVDAWLTELLRTVEQLPNGSTPGVHYIYHLPHCVFTQLYEDNSLVRAAYDAVPFCKVGYCQRNANGVELCKGLTSSCPIQGPLLREGADTIPDPLKLMYKGVSALAHMDWSAYDAHIKEARVLVEPIRA